MQLPAVKFFNTVPFVIGQDLRAKKKPEFSKVSVCQSAVIKGQGSSTKNQHYTWSNYIDSLFVTKVI